MPILTTSEPGTVTGLMSAAPGFRVDVYAPTADAAAGVPTASTVVAWVMVADPDSAGGVRVDPVFLADGRAWTPDQFRATYGASLTFAVAAA